MDGASVGTVPHCSRLRPLEPPPALQKCRDFAWNESCFAARDMSRRLLVGTLLATAATLGLVFTVGRRTPVYSIGVAEFVERGLADERVRVRGTLVHGTLCKMETGCGYRFRLEDRDRWRTDATRVPTSRGELPVSYDGCDVLDALRDVPGLDLGVVVEGERCEGCHDFQASQVFTVSSGKYEFNRNEALARLALPVPDCKAQPARL